MILLSDCWGHQSNKDLVISAGGTLVSAVITLDMTAKANSGFLMRLKSPYHHKK